MFTTIISAACLASSGGNFKVGFSHIVRSVPAQQDTVKVRRPKDPDEFGFRAQQALDEGRFSDALDLVLQAKSVNPTPENEILYAEVLAELGRYPEAFAVFERNVDLSGQPEQQYEVAVLANYAASAMESRRFDKAQDLYVLTLSCLAQRRILNNGVEKITAVDPGRSSDREWLPAARVAVELFTRRARSEPMTAHEVDEAFVAALRKIDRLAPRWDRVWPLLLWSIDREYVQVRAFAKARLSRLANSSDAELRRVVELLLKTS